ncbi:PUA domain-containing protein [Hyperthermus butylicus]|uniref:RNA modification enzyme n=1 Tax=Hyperthermus butylicus (strain DSM 5456 / JCM 9403 / PLM1-5) TaxID=415426 RepID=A2BK24_HYPBU|nr:PUA domain-containing protein [Hyperthermus butylicus]ABM80335.1 putative RNA modification enzyme [Hyperthermus butylicus DSM 5456]
MIIRRARPEEVVRLRAIADYQFGFPAGDLLIPDNVVVGVSPATRRIREIYGEEGLLAVLRAHDYLYSLSLLGAKRLLALPEPRLRARLRVETPPSKSINCRIIETIDHDLRPGDEVIVLNSSGELVGVGRLRLSPTEILENECWGEAIRLRKTVKGDNS